VQRSVVLLTTTAATFFLRFGFRPVDRSAAPEAIRSSAELSGACPSSATMMLLDLRRPAVWVRRAGADDIPAITAIYNEGIQDGGTLETELRTVDERRRWLLERAVRHPVLAAIRQGQCIGWGCLSPFNARAAYRHVADISIYVERTTRRSGVGRALIDALLLRARELAFHKVVLTTFPQNTSAVRLYEEMGFRTVGDYREQGMLFGKWTDTRIMERILA
jgi:L-amino acid N-acyltransferase YncA